MTTKKRPVGAIDLREASLEALLQAKALVQADGTVAPGDAKAFDGYMAEAKDLDRDSRTASGDGSPGPDASLDQLIDQYTKPARGGLLSGAMRFSSRGGGWSGGLAVPGGLAGPVGWRPTVDRGPSWTDAVLERGGHGLTAALLDPVGTAVVSVPLRVEPVTDPRRARFVAELLPEEGAPGGHYAYLRQTVRTNLAAAVAKLARKPTSIYTLQRVDDRTRTIAHLTEPIARQDISDATLLRQFIDSELTYGLNVELDRQVVSAAGAGEDLTGILESGIADQPFDTDALTTTRMAVTVLQTTDFVPDAWVINPTDWETIELEALAQFASNANMTGPTGILDRLLWSIPVMVSNAIAAGTALLGDFAGSAILYRTGPVQIDWSEGVFDPDFAGGGATDFERNAVRFRGELRAGLAVTRPLGFVSVDLAAGS